MRVTLSLNNKNLPFDNAQADYELNPYRRRGGEERAPNPAASVVSYFAYYWTSCVHFHLRQYFDSVDILQEDRLRWTSLGSASLQSNFMADAVIGRLPQGLSVDEREKIFASTPLSPALNLLSSMPLVCSCFERPETTVMKSLPWASKDFVYHKKIILSPLPGQSGKPDTGRSPLAASCTQRGCHCLCHSRVLRKEIHL